MAEVGADVTVYTTNVDGQGGILPIETGCPMDIGGVKTTYFPSTFGRNSVWDSRELSRRLEQTISDFDIVYVSAIWQWIGMSTGRLAKKYHVPYVIGTHGSFDSEKLKNGRMKKLLWWHLLLKSNLHCCSAIHLTTEYERRQAVLLDTDIPKFVVPNCMQSHVFKPQKSLGIRLRKEFGIPLGAPLLITVGRSHPEKRVDLTLDSFQIVHRSFPDSRLIIVGDYENNYGMKMKAKSGAMKAADAIIWTGYRRDDGLAGCYAAADLFLLPSIGENFSMVVTEAMAAGVPVIVSDHVGVADAVSRSEAGVVTKVSAREMARAALEILSNKERLRETGLKARKAALQLYSGKQVAPLMLRAFEDVVSGVRRKEC